MTGTVTRRELLALLVAGIALLVGVPPAGALTAIPAPATEAELNAWLDAALAGADFSGVATAWRAGHPGEATRDALARAVLAGRRRGEPLGAFLSRAVAAEHAAGRAELLDGWYLAPTEARLAALAHGAR